MLQQKKICQSLQKCLGNIKKTKTLVGIRVVDRGKVVQNIRDKCEFTTILMTSLHQYLFSFNDVIGRHVVNK